MTEARPPLLGPEDLRRIGDLGLVARSIVEGTLTGLHRSPYHGFSVEFAESREYVRGDDLRHFDWKAFARSDRSTIKKYHSETNLAAHLAVDRSASMGFGDPSKLRYAAALAAALAHLLAGQQDAVGLAVLCDGAVAREPPSMGSTHARHLLDLLEALSAEGRTLLGPALHELAGSLRRKGVVLLFSDLHDETASVLEGIRRLRFDGHEVDVFHVLDPAELRLAWDDALELEDLETGERMEIQAPAVRDEYEARVRAWTDELRAGCDGCGADYLRVETNVAFAVTLAEWLRTRRLRRSR